MIVRCLSDGDFMGWQCWGGYIGYFLWVELVVLVIFVYCYCNYDCYCYYDYDCDCGCDYGITVIADVIAGYYSSCTTTILATVIY